jgi:hypothetical protein
MKGVDLVRLLVALLLFGPSQITVRADGGIIRLREAQGPFLVTIFTAAEPVQDGLCDISVLVQRRDSGAAILDATVDLLFTPPPGSVMETNEPLCDLPKAPLSGPGTPQRPVRATRAKASNKLLYAAPIRFGAIGNWRLEAIVSRGSDFARATCIIAVGPPAGRLIGLLPYLLLSPLIVILFAINQASSKGVRRLSSPGGQKSDHMINSVLPVKERFSSRGSRDLSTDTIL